MQLIKASGNKTFVLIFIVGIMIFPAQTIFPQTGKLLNSADELKKLAEHEYGPDDLLVNGSMYIPERLRAEGNPYYQDDNWFIGTIIIKGKSFQNVEFIYHVELDRVIIMSKDMKQNKIAVLLNNDFVDSFYWKEHYFINLNELNLTGRETGFAELIFKSGFTFIIRHKKVFLNDYSQSNQFGRYSKLQSIRYIQSGDQLVKVQTKKMFLEYFNPYQVQLKKYLRTNNIKYSDATKNELYGLLKYCDELSGKK
jgi:hypothetical protein